MRIALDISPLSTGHKVRGTGFYVLHLKNALEKYFPENDYTFFTNKTQIPQNADIIHYPYFDPFSLTVPLSHAEKTIITVLDLTPIKFPKAFPAGIKGNLKWQLQRYSLHKVAGVLTDSLSAQKDIQKFVGIPTEKISVAYLAAGEEFRKMDLSANERNTYREKYNLPEAFVLYVGDVTWNKNLPRLVQAAIDAKIPLVMVGKALVSTDFDRNNPWNKDLITVQKLASKNKNIIRLGFLPSEDIVALYNMATAFTMPSLYEGFGLPILEAMACGCPVITSKEASLPEVGGDGAYYTNAYETSAIAHSISEVFEDKKLQNELSKKGLENVKRFSWKKTASETLQFYKSILEK